MKGSFSVYANSGGKCPTIRSEVALVVELKPEVCKTVDRSKSIVEVSAEKLSEKVTLDGISYSADVNGGDLYLTVKGHSFVLYPAGRKA